MCYVVGTLTIEMDRKYSEINVIKLYFTVIKLLYAQINLIFTLENGSCNWQFTYVIDWHYHMQ